MAILGIQEVQYGVEQLDEAVRFFEDFGLTLTSRSAQEAVFTLPERSRVVLKHIDDPSLPPAAFAGSGIRETIFSVDSQAHLDALVKRIEAHVPVRRGEDGTVHFGAPCGEGISLGFGLTLNQRVPVVTVPTPINAPGSIRRLNRYRPHIDRARPKGLQHIVYAIPGYQQLLAFLTDVLNFRVSDEFIEFGSFCRADGSTEHHNVFILDCMKIPPKRPLFLHLAFLVDDIDEVMIGHNYLRHRGWKPNGLTRFMLGSSLSVYTPCPAGGEAEYLADSDAFDDSWETCRWDMAEIGNYLWSHDPSPFARWKPAPNDA